MYSYLAYTWERNRQTHLLPSARGQAEAVWITLGSQHEHYSSWVFQPSSQSGVDENSPSNTNKTSTNIIKNSNSGKLGMGAHVLKSGTGRHRQEDLWAWSTERVPGWPELLRKTVSKKQKENMQTNKKNDNSILTSCAKNAHCITSKWTQTVTDLGFWPNFNLQERTSDLWSPNSQSLLGSMYDSRLPSATNRTKMTALLPKVEWLGSYLKQHYKSKEPNGWLSKWMRTCSI